jgi:hypothetical protein
MMTYIYIYIYIYIYDIYIYIIYIYIYIYIYTHTHTHTYIHTYIHIYIYSDAAGTRRLLELDERVAKARTWEEIQAVTKEYLVAHSRARGADMLY